MPDLGFVDKTSFGDVCLDDMGIVVERVHDEIEGVRDNLEEFAGRDGSLYRTMTIPERTITLECRAFERDWRGFDELVDDLMSEFAKSRDEQELRLRTRHGEHYLAHFTGYSEGDRVGGSGIGGFTLTFTASDPYRYEDDESSTPILTANTPFTVGGTAPVKVVIESSLARVSTANDQWGVRFDDGDFTHVVMPTSAQSTVMIDSASRTVTINNESSMITLGSNWMELVPGSHVARVDLGFGGATLRWRNRSI